MRKEDLPTKINQKPIKIGDKVMIIDGSYMISADKIDEYDPIAVDREYNSIGKSKDVFEVLDINKPFPTRYGGDDWLQYQNNCKIKNIRTGEIWYCSKINVRNTEAIWENINWSNDKYDSL